MDSPEPPKNPFRIVTVPPRKQKRYVAPTIDDLASPETPLAPFECQPGVIPSIGPNSKNVMLEALTNQFMTREDSQKVAATLMMMVQNGNLDAMKLVFGYLLGKPGDGKASSGGASPMDDLIQNIDIDSAEAIIAAANRFKKEA